MKLDDSILTEPIYTEEAVAEWRARHPSARRKFSEDQPRDENGRWTDAGGGGASPASGGGGYGAALDKVGLDPSAGLREVFDTFSYNDKISDDDVTAALAHFKAEKVSFPNGDEVHVGIDADTQYVIEDDLSPTEAVEWVNRINDPTDYYPTYEDDQNRDFWESTPDLWHHTTEEHVEAIREEGLRPTNQTRGISNRGVGAAVFTSDDPEEYALGEYGDVAIRIDTAAMKSDGRTPYTSREPDVVEYELRGAIASRLGLTNYESESEQGMSPNTVIVHGHIPAKYLDIEMPTKALRAKYATFLKGGPGSGNFGHAGRPGEIGGSAPGGGSAGPPAGVLESMQKPDGGFTYHAVSGHQPKIGYALSIHKDRERIMPASEATVDALAQYAHDNWDLLQQNTKYLGGWHNPDDNQVYLDVSTVVSSASEAEALGRAHGQLAYFDLARGQSVAIDHGKAHTQSRGTKGRATDLRGSARARAPTDGSGADAGGDPARARDLRRTQAPEVNKFDEDQPRDDHGRWSDTGAGGGASSGSAASGPAATSAAFGSEPVAVYHGTGVDAAREIKANGILARKNYDQRGRPPSVYLTESYMRAKYYADWHGLERGPDGYFHGDVAIVEVKIPSSVWEAEAIPDEHDDEHSYRIERDVPPSWIGTIDVITDRGALRPLKAATETHTAYVVVLCTAGAHKSGVVYLEKFDPDQPRDEHGRWSEAGAGGGGSTADTHGAARPDYLSSPKDAWHDMAAGQHTTIAKEDLRGLLDYALTKNEQGDLTKVTLEGTPIFAGGLNLARDQMPQISDANTEGFLRSLRDAGISVHRETVRPMSLVPTQKEIGAQRVAKMLQGFEAGDTQQLREIMISKDHRVLDGHHRWAMAVALETENRAVRMDVIRLGVGYRRALRLMHEYGRAHGEAAVALGAPLPRQKFSEDQPRDDHGRWTDGGGGASAATSHGAAHGPATETAFVDRMAANLGSTSRTSAGEEHPLPGKPRLEGAGQARIDRVNANTRAAAAYVWQHKDDAFNTAVDVHRVIEHIGTTVNAGVTSGPLWREHETGRNIPAADISRELATFEHQFTQRVDARDVVKTAAWVEYEFNGRIHPFADGVGRSSKLLSGLVLARAGHDLPRYGPNADYFRHLDRPLSEFTTYYRGLFPGTAKGVVYLEKFDENQPRDDHGRWTDAGGGGGGGAAPSSGGIAPGGPQLIAKPSGEYHPLHPDGRDTRERFSNHGQYTPEREALHVEIVSRHMKDTTPVEQPEAVILGGGPASGKTAVVAPEVAKANTVIVDADRIRTNIPEYRERVGTDPNAATYTHEESSDVSKQLLRTALNGRRNVVLDGIADDTIEKLAAKTGAMRAAGHRVVAHYVTVDTETALARAAQRAKETGRRVPESFIRATHAAVSRVVPEALSRGLFDRFELTDTGGPKPVRVASAVGRVLKIYDKQRWDAFIAKGQG